MPATGAIESPWLFSLSRGVIFGTVAFSFQ
jgi:hypothetical protein